MSCIIVFSLHTGEKLEECKKQVRLRGRFPRVFGDEFGEEFGDKFGDDFSESLNLVMNLVENLATNLVIHQNW